MTNRASLTSAGQAVEDACRQLVGGEDPDGVFAEELRADDFLFTPQEEQEIGLKISGMLSARYGVVQDAAIHK